MTELVGPGVDQLRHVSRYAVLADRRDGEVARAMADGTTEASVFRLASLTKPFTAVAALLACRRAGIDPGTPVLELLPELRPDWAADRGLTIAHLLSQTSGLAGTVTAADVARLGDDDTSLLETARLVVRAGSTRPPGDLWAYDNGNYFLAGAVLAALTSTTYEAAVHDLVLAPWGLVSTTFQPVEAYPRGRRPSGGLRSSAADVVALGRHVLDDADLRSSGLPCAVGPSGQLYLNGRLPGCRSALLLVPDDGLVAVALADDADALPALARTLSDLQVTATGDDLTRAIDTFAA